MKTFVEKVVVKTVREFTRDEEDTEVLRNYSLGFSGSYPIEELENILKEFKEKGATHIIIEQDEDHQEYTFIGTVIKEV